jgi:hypothetical protein
MTGVSKSGTDIDEAALPTLGILRCQTALSLTTTSAASAAVGPDATHVTIFCDVAAFVDSGTAPVAAATTGYWDFTKGPLDLPVPHGQAFKVALKTLTGTGTAYINER